MSLCLACAEQAFAGWKGWPGVDPLPEVPALSGGCCPRCRGVRDLDPAHIVFRSVGGATNEGIPRHFVLAIVAPNLDEYRHWRPVGLPYADERLPPVPRTVADAIWAGDWVGLVRLLRTGRSLTATDEQGWTALNVAISRNHLAAARLLLEHGADPDRPDAAGNPPLHLAVALEFDADRMVALLLERGASVGTRDRQGETPFRRATRSQQGKPVLKKLEDLLLKKGADPQDRFVPPPPPTPEELARRKTEGERARDEERFREAMASYGLPPQPEYREAVLRMVWQADYASALRLLPPKEDFAGLLLAGICHFHRGHLEQALAFFRRTERWGRSVALHTYLGRALLQQGLEKDAWREFRRAQALDRAAGSGGAASGRTTPDGARPGAGPVQKFLDGFDEFGVHSELPHAFRNVMERRLLADPPEANLGITETEIAIRNSSRTFPRGDLLGVSTAGFRVFDRFEPPWQHAVVLVIDRFGNVPVSRFTENNHAQAAAAARLLAERLGVPFIACDRETYPAVVRAPRGTLIVPLMVYPDDPPFHHR